MARRVSLTEFSARVPIRSLAWQILIPLSAKAIPGQFTDQTPIRSIILKVASDCPLPDPSKHDVDSQVPESLARQADAARRLAHAQLVRAALGAYDHEGPGSHLRQQVARRGLDCSGQVRRFRASPSPAKRAIDSPRGVPGSIAMSHGPAPELSLHSDTANPHPSGDRRSDCRMARRHGLATCWGAG